MTASLTDIRCSDYITFTVTVTGVLQFSAALKSYEYAC